MAELLKELNRISRKPPHKKKKWGVGWFSLYPPILANGVMFLRIAKVSPHKLLPSDPFTGLILFGALLFQFWYILDSVNGQVARYYNQSGLIRNLFRLHQL